MRKELEGDMVFDGGAIIELVYSTPSGKQAKEAIKGGKLKPFVTEVSMAEAKYVLCRKLGDDEASSRMSDIRESNTITIEPLSGRVSNLAGQFKCERSISLADCFALALGKSKEIPVLFARKEKEIEKEMKAKPFDVEIVFLEDLGTIRKENIV